MRRHLLVLLAIVLCVPAVVHATCGGGGGGGMGGMMPQQQMDRGGRPDVYFVPWKVLKADDAPLPTPVTLYWFTASATIAGGSGAACGAMRGHGTVNVRFAFESQLDEICAALKLDPLEIRQKNLLKPPCITVNGLRVLSYGLPECIDVVARESKWTFMLCMGISTVSKMRFVR